MSTYVDQDAVVKNEIGIAIQKVIKVRTMLEKSDRIASKGHLLFGECLQQLADIAETFGEE